MARESRQSRSRSPHKDREGHHRSHKRKRSKSPIRTRPLPFSARILDKHDYTTYRHLFASYLDIQKRLDLDDITESEAKGRWKSFIKKWNHGDLAEGWYDPERLKTSRRMSPSIKTKSVESRLHPVPSVDKVPDDEEDDDYGPAPALPSNLLTRAGPSIPTMDDIALRREGEAEDRESSRALAKASRRADAKLEKARLEELAPRAEAGTRERQLEKKRELAASNRAFAESKGGVGGGTGMAEIPESDLMGAGEDDSLEGIKRRKQEEERKLTDRELRREEIARAKREEIERRKQDFVDKEEERTRRFIELAKMRFGG